MKLSANGIDINYSVEGSGPWVTLSHSLACNLGMWEPQISALAQRYTVLRYDTRGHGQTSAPAGPYSFELLAQDLHALLRGLGIEKTHFVGLSMGGMIGQTFALKHPEMLHSLALCDTTSRYPAEAAKAWDERIALARRDSMSALVESTLQRWFTPAFRARAAQSVAAIARQIEATPVEGYAGCAAAIVGINTTARLSAIKCPVLVLVGEDDPGTPVAMSREIHAAIPASKLVVLPQAAHLSNIEQAESFNQALLEFLAASDR